VTNKTNPTSSRAPEAPPVPQAQAPGNDHTNLNYLYRSIGIQAVAAAARYSRTKPAAAPSAHRIDQRFIESAV
jgi:hypothetical protein